MSDVKKITTPLSAEVVKDLKAGDTVLITGTIYSARDAAHKRMVETIQKGQEVPIPLKGQIIYFMGPSPARPGKPIGSAGPTTSYRMDPYSPTLIAHGLAGMVGKGARGKEVVEAMKKYGAVYFNATGGAAALISRSIKEAEIVAYDDLGAEAIRRLKVVDFPATVAQDCHGNNLYEQGVAKYKVN